MISTGQGALIRDSWQAMGPRAIHVADLFFDRLFELDPSLEERFPEDVAAQRARFVQVVDSAVRAADDTSQLLSHARELGRRTPLEGLGSGHYLTMTMALLWSLEQTLAEDFTRPLERAWAAVCAVVSRGLGQIVEARDVPRPRPKAAQLAL